MLFITIILYYTLLLEKSKKSGRLYAEFSEGFIGFPFSPQHTGFQKRQSLRHGADAPRHLPLHKRGFDSASAPL